MSPEQVRGNPADKRADVWAFGCCLYEALTSRKAIVGETAADIVAGIVGNEPDWAAVSGLSIERLLRLLLKKNARDRLRDMGDVRIELENQASASDAPPVVFPARPRRGLVALMLLVGVLRRHHNWDGADIIVHRLDTGERQVLIEGGTDARYVPTGHLVFSRDRTLHAVAYDSRQRHLHGLSDSNPSRSGW